MRVTVRKMVRRPAKKIICGLLLLVISTTGLLFFLQYWIDGVSLASAERYYSYIGTIYDPAGEHPDFDPISEEALEVLRASECISEFDVRHTYSCKVPDLIRVADWFLEDIPYDLAHWYILGGTVADMSEIQAYGQQTVESFKLQVDKYWAGVQQKFDVLNIDLYHSPGDQKRNVREGEYYFIVGHYRFPGNRGAANYVSVYQALYSELMPGVTWRDDSLLLSAGLMKLPEDMTENEREEYIQEILQEKKLTILRETINGVGDVYTLHTIGDMSLLLPVKEETMFFPCGRELTREDAGRKVCVISQELAQKNGLKIGDKLLLSVSEHNYVADQYSFYAGHESGVPYEYDVILDDYISCGEFEIVGTYEFLNRDIFRGSYAFSYNDIFIPKDVLAWDNTDLQDAVKPYQMSFSIPGMRYEEFLDESETALVNKGYYMRISTSRWNEVKDSFQVMQERRIWMFAGAIIAFLAGIGAFDCLLLVQNRKEYALMRMLGAYIKEARGVFYGMFVLCGFSAALLSVLAGGIAYQQWLLPRMSEIELPNAAMPQLGQCIGVMGCLVLAELVVAFIVLRLLIRWLEQRSLLNLLK